MMTIITSKMSEMEKLFKKGMEEVQMIVDKFYQGTVKGIAGSIIGAAKKGPGGQLGDVDEGGLGGDMRGSLAALDTISDPEMIKAKLEEQEEKLKEMVKKTLITKL
jgi:hypothetical protein